MNKNLTMQNTQLLDLRSQHGARGPHHQGGDDAEPGLRVAFAMTINKAQGLKLQRVGVYLQDDVFSQGQLYVALSRCGDDLNLWAQTGHSRTTRESSG